MGGGGKADAPAAPQPYQLAGYNSQADWEAAKKDAADKMQAYEDQQNQLAQQQADSLAQMQQEQADALNQQTAYYKSQAAQNAATNAANQAAIDKRTALAAQGRAGTVLTSGQGDTSTPSALKPNLGS